MSVGFPFLCPLDLGVGVGGCRSDNQHNWTYKIGPNTIGPLEESGVKGALSYRDVLHENHLNLAF